MTSETMRAAEELASRVHAGGPARAPALSLAVANRAGVIWSGAYGKADLEFDVAATPDHLFRLGSVSKVVTATAAARLAARGAIDLDAPISDRHVLIVEDIIDSGLTLHYLMRSLKARNPASLEACALLTKPDRLRVDLSPRYVGFEIPNRFAVGYGLDHAQRYRNLDYVAALNE